MVLYVPKNRYVTLLSTLHTEKSVSESDDKKPGIMNFYNATKSGVDVLDERVGTYRCKRKVNRWPMAIFENMLDISASNAFVIFTELKPTWKGKEKKYRRRLFIVDVADDLISPYILARKALPKGAIASELVQRIQGVPADFDPPATNTLQKLPQANKRSRCHVCTSKNNMNLYCFRCDRCKKYVCGNHLYKICDKCVRNFYFHVRAILLTKNQILMHSVFFVAIFFRWMRVKAMKFMTNKNQRERYVRLTL